MLVWEKEYFILISGITLKIFIILFGLLIGSFLNALIYRLPREIDIVFARSACPNCQHLIRWFENIPLFSFIFLRGKCAHCKGKISWQYPIVEALGGLAAWYLAPEEVTLLGMVNFLFFFSIFCCFVVHAWIDFEHQILPDGVTIYLAALFLAYALVYHSWQSVVGGLLIGGVFPAAVAYGFYLWKKVVGLGMGDIKLYAALGIYLGPMGIISNIFLSCLLGSIVGIILVLLKRMAKDHPMPFGPFIILIATWQIFFPQSFSQVFSFLVFVQPN